MSDFPTEPFGSSTDPGDELFDVVDERDMVLRQATRRDVHANGWLHRAVQIWVFRPDGRLLVHQRSADRDECPLLWSSSAAGHLNAGEDYESAALRELMEEMGLFGELEHLAIFPAGPDTNHEFTGFFRARIDTLPTPDPAEVAAWEYRTLDELEADITDHPERFTPVFRHLLPWYRERTGQSGV